MKKIWIINHYATNMYFNKNGRHYCLAKNLVNVGYEVTIFCANTVHNSKKYVNISEGKFKTEKTNDIPFVFVKTPTYSGNGVKRLINMFTFFKNLIKIAKLYSKQNGRPDIIYASSVHPLALVAGIKISKKFNIPCICEVRDLWPLTLVEMKKLGKNSIFTRLLYKGELWIYKNADSIIFTGEGEKRYIIDKKWDKKVLLNKIYYLNNGVDIELFNNNCKYNMLSDYDLNTDKFKVIYTGSLRPANDVKTIVNIAEYISKTEYSNKIVFLIYGDGMEKECIYNYITEKGLTNIKLKGKVDKKYIPYILSKSDLNILHYSKKLDLFRYGGSQNKLFEYFASGKPTLSTIKMNPDILLRYNCGLTIQDIDYKNIGNGIIKIYNLNKDKYNEMCNNAMKAAMDYDYKTLTKKLEIILNNTLTNIHDHSFESSN